MRITKEDLIKLLSQAFDEGYTGYKEMRDQIAEKIAEDYSNTTKEEVSPSVYQGTFFNVGTTIAGTAVTTGSISYASEPTHIYITNQI